jgi:hypothetical protein
MADAIRQIGVSEVTYYRWRQEFGGLKIEQVRRLKDLELRTAGCARPSCRIRRGFPVALPRDGKVRRFLRNDHVQALLHGRAGRCSGRRHPELGWMAMIG